jgi:hypothetical protein
MPKQSKMDAAHAAVRAAGKPAFQAAYNAMMKKKAELASASVAAAAATITRNTTARNKAEQAIRNAGKPAFQAAYNAMMKKKAELAAANKTGGRRTRKNRNRRSGTQKRRY